ncbi:MAG TPA: cyanophycinase [Thermoanaerobaculia bacterium]|jgi:cyanophycinase|nr:cyanophycinase [Thermoanaerobaculia bacterium]
METSEGPAAGRPGTLFAIGGAEDKMKERLILRSFVEACGGADAQIVVLATASELPETAERYADLFYKLQADSVEVLRIATREDAIDAGPETLDLLEYSTGLFMTGGNQLRITSALGGTTIAKAIHRRHRAGMVVAGTSAGAAVISEYMISMGDSGGTPRRRLVQMAKGLGLAPHLVIDQHFRRRDRLGRLLTALSYNPEPLGVGIDEDTAAILEGDGIMRVLGSGAVTVVDASGMRFTDSHMADRDQPLAMLGLKLDFLTTGCRYDLNRRYGIPPAQGEVKRSGDFETSDVAKIADTVESLP